MPPITVYWDETSATTIIAEFTEPWDWNDFHLAVSEIHHMIAGMEAVIDIIIWHKKYAPPPNPMAHFSRTLRQQPANTGQTVIVLPPGRTPFDSFLKTIATILQRTYPGKFPVASVTTLEEARILLANRRAGKPGR